MAIDGAEIVQAVLIADRIGVVPVEEMLFDAGTLGVVADGALAGVTFESREGGIIVVGVEFRRGDLFDFFAGSFLMLMPRFWRGFAIGLGVAAAFHDAMRRGLFSGARFPFRAGLAFLLRRGAAGAVSESAGGSAGALGGGGGMASMTFGGEAGALCSGIAAGGDWASRSRSAAAINSAWVRTSQRGFCRVVSAKRSSRNLRKHRFIFFTPAAG